MPTQEHEARIRELRKPVEIPIQNPVSEVQIEERDRLDGQGRERHATGKFAYVLVKKDGKFHLSSESFPVTPVQPDDHLASLPFPASIEATYKLSQQTWKYFIETRLPSIFIKDSHPPQPVKAETFKLATLLLDISNRKKGTNIYERHKEAVGSKYRADLASAGGKRARLGIKNRLIQERDRTLSEIDAKISKEKTLINSGCDLMIKEFLTTDGGVEKLRLAIADLKNAVSDSESAEGQIISDVHFSYLFDAVAERLRDLPKGVHLRYFGYKETPHHLLFDQRGILTQNIGAAFENTSSATDVRIRNISRALLDYYARNVENLFSLRDEPQPYSAFVYDFFFAAASLKDPQLFLDASDWLFQKNRLGEKRAEGRLVDEIKSNAIPSIEEMLKAYERLNIAFSAKPRTGLQSDLIGFIGSPPPDFVSDWIREHKKQHVAIGFSNDRLDGLWSAFRILGKAGRKDLYSDSGVMHEMAKALVAKLAEGRTSVSASDIVRDSEALVYINRAVKTWRNTLAMVDPQMRTLDALATNLMDIDLYSEIIGRIVNLSQTQLRQKNLYIDALTDDVVRGMEPEMRRIYSDNLFILSLTAESNTQTPENMTEEKEYCEKLAADIRDRNEWFVAPWGDAFTLTDGNNLDLRDQHITSLVFYPDRLTQGHKVVISTDIVSKSEGKPLQLEFYIDREGNLYHGNRQPVTIHLWALSPFSKLLLERINFITSGVLSKNMEVVLPTITSRIAGQERKVSHIRPHWRHLFSTPVRPITLQSDSAQEHAAWVENVYGIKIYDENLRRRDAGLLKFTDVEKEYITFVKEFDDETAPQTPNQLAYKTQTT
ncbi:hypothetical protein M1271_00330 [Patescibacteria group bacterium]|nr:hypothetical protein [Patescibacteria group bacterium]